MHNAPHYKELLEKELQILESELSDVGRKNPDNPDDWEATAAPLNIDLAEEEERAEAITEFEDRVAIESDLETRLMLVRAALDRIANGTYGVCAVCKAPIEMARLEVNPAAETCIADRETKLS